MILKYWTIRSELDEFVAREKNSGFDGYLRPAMGETGAKIVGSTLAEVRAKLEKNGLQPSVIKGKEIWTR